MSSYIKQLKNPKTGKLQVAYCIDDYFGSHEYGYGFRKDGKDAVFGELLFDSEYDFYRWEEIPQETPPVIQRFREVEDVLESIIWSLEGKCATCGSSEDHKFTDDKVNFTHQFDNRQAIFILKQFILQEQELLRKELAEKVEKISISDDSCTGCIDGIIKLKDKVLALLK